MKHLNLLPILIICLLPACRNKIPTSAAEEITRVRVIPVVNKEISIPVHSSGILAPADETKLSFKTGGIIEKVNVSEGQKVRKGDMLASLDPVEIRSAVNQARNGYEKALRDFNRAENLYRDSVATLEMRQNAATALDVAKSTFEVAEFNLKHSEIKAPSDGVILKQLARKNELIAAGYPVFLFGASGKYWKIKTGLSDRNIVKVSPGDSAAVIFDAYPNVKFAAVVGETGAMADPYTGTYETELLLVAGNYRLASGFIASVDIYPAAKETFPAIPLGSITQADGFSGYVYAVTDSGTVTKIKVNIRNMPGEMAAVTGIPGNVTEVVSEGAAYLKDGMKVVVIP
ncbi:MAG TPA: efflux RND transporter periplasmic adaptor subunit [Bacteroidales bacterium]|nr:efflux RND transporter periplasmic adaptor subunit [Bacteroidales bacterium]